MIKIYKIIIVDDNVPFRVSLKSFVEKELGSIVVAEASNGEEYLKLPNLFDADVALMDIMMDKMNGFEACKRALYYNHNIKMLAVTMHMEKVFLLNLVEAGFKGCVYKSDVFEDLATAIETIMKGKYYFPEGIRIDNAIKR
jgi:DNA-binding NarL/FixJ family response regulator